MTARQQLRVDTPATRRRLARLGRYVDTNLLRGNTFVCRGLCQCKGSIALGDDYREGVMSHVGKRFDLFLGDRPLRIVVVGQESGLPKGPRAREYSRKVSLQSRHRQVTQTTGLERRYYADIDHPARNPHMRGTTSALRVLLGPGLGTDFDEEFVHPVNGRPFHLFEAFALVNRLLCSAGPMGTSQGRPTRQMLNNCADHFAATLDILEPTIVILQGAKVAQSTREMFTVTRTHTDHLHEAERQGRRLLLCTFSHPSARGALRWGDSPNSPYMTQVVTPTLQRAIRRL